MNNPKVGCSPSKKKLQMNKDLLKIRLLYNSDCIYHPLQPVIKITEWKKKQKKLLLS